MKIIKTSGCTNFSTSVDGYNISHQEISDEVYNKLKDKLSEYIRSFNKQDISFFVENLVEWYGEYECEDEPCETCGDYFTKYELTI